MEKDTHRRIPQVVYLTLTQFEPDGRREARVHYIRPHAMKRGHVFHIFIHLDVVEDLLFFHHPREELLAEGRVPWRALA